MNERIRELAVQADLLIKKTNGDEFRYGNFDPKFQKFAELIIKECANVAADHEALDIYEEIREHFGVSE